MAERVREIATHYQRAYNSSMCPGAHGAPCGRPIGMRGRMADRCFDCAEYRTELIDAARKAKRAKGGYVSPSRRKKKEQDISRPSDLRDRIFAEPGRKARKMCQVCCNMPWVRRGVCTGCGLPSDIEREVAPRSFIGSSAALALLA